MKMITSGLVATSLSTVAAKRKRKIIYISAFLMHLNLVFFVHLLYLIILSNLFLISLVLKQYKKGFIRAGPRIEPTISPFRSSNVKTTPILVSTIRMNVGA